MSQGQEWWGVAESAAHCGVKPGTWRDYVSRGHAPPPADLDEGSPLERRRPRWRAETVRTWHAARPGKGGPPTEVPRDLTPRQSESGRPRPLEG